MDKSHYQSFLVVLHNLQRYAKELKEKWLSLLYHITHKHRWENSEYLKSASTKNQLKKERASKPFLKARPSTFIALKMLVKEKSLRNDLKYPTTFNHTGTLKVYYSLYNKYCSKPLHFSYEDVITLSQLLQMLVLNRLTLNLGNLENLPNQRLQNKLSQKRLNLSEPFDG